jgi:heptosyltransferase-2
MRKILVVNMNYIGDTLMTTPALSALRRAYPDAQIDTVVGAGSAADVLLGNPDLDRIIARTARGSWGRCVQIFRLLREERYTDAIILPPLPAYALAAFLARTPVRVGQANRGMNRFLTHLMPVDAVHMADVMLATIDTQGAPPVVERNGTMVGHLRPALSHSVTESSLPLRESPGSGNDVMALSGRRLTVVVEQDALDFAQQLLQSTGVDTGRPLVAINLGATRPQKRWFAESFAGLIDELPGMQTLLVGAGQDDAALAQTVADTVRTAKPASIVGMTTVKQLAGVLSLCDVLVSADSGPMHVSTAVGTPVVALFGSTDPAVTGPYDTVSRSLYKALPCAPCGNHPTCGGRFDCLRAISPEEVAEQVMALVRERRPIREPEPARPGRVGQVGPPDSKGDQRTRQQRLQTGVSAPNRTGIVPRKAPAKADYRRILIATKFRFIGDTLVAIPIFRAARAQWPDARIVLLTGPNARVLLQNNPYLDEIIEFDPYRTDSGQRAFWRLVRRLRRAHFDLGLVLNRSFHSALVPWLGGIATRAGFESEGRGALLNRRVEYDKQKSEVACYFDVLRAVAPEAPIDPLLELWVTPDEAAAARARIENALCAVDGSSSDESEIWIGIQPGASLDGKRWPAARFAALADSLTSADPRARIVLIGSADEKRVAGEMMSFCSPETCGKMVSFVGACNLRESLAIVSHLQLFIGNDTAVMHSAVALKVPTVALFGPTNPRKWGNYGDRHRVLESPDGTMSGIATADVVATARELLS